MTYGSILAMARDLWDHGHIVRLELKGKRFAKRLQDLRSRGCDRAVAFDAEGQPGAADLTGRTARQGTV